jgi:hypothetical protein
MQLSNNHSRELIVALAFEESENLIKNVFIFYSIILVSNGSNYLFDYLFYPLVKLFFGFLFLFIFSI